MIRSLDKKWKEFLFAFSAFGPNFLMILMGSYYSDALNPAALEAGEQFQTIMPGICFILPPEIEEFRYVLYTMREDEVAGWVRSLQLRQVELPDELKDEVFLIIGERRQ